MKKFLFLFLLLIPLFTFAQTGEHGKYTLEGVVLLKNTENTIPYVQVFIKEIGRLAALSFYANNFTNSKPRLTDNARPDYLRKPGRPLLSCS